MRKHAPFAAYHLKGFARKAKNYSTNQMGLGFHVPCEAKDLSLSFQAFSLSSSHGQRHVRSAAPPVSVDPWFDRRRAGPGCREGRRVLLPFDSLGFAWIFHREHSSEVSQVRFFLHQNQQIILKTRLIEPLRPSDVKSFCWCS